MSTGPLKTDHVILRAKAQRPCGDLRQIALSPVASLFKVCNTKIILAQSLQLVKSWLPFLFPLGSILCGPKHGEQKRVERVPQGALGLGEKSRRLRGLSRLGDAAGEANGHGASLLNDTTSDFKIRDLNLVAPSHPVP